MRNRPQTLEPGMLGRSLREPPSGEDVAASGQHLRTRISIAY